MTQKKINGCSTPLPLGTTNLAIFGQVLLMWTKTAPTSGTMVHPSTIGTGAPINHLKPNMRATSTSQVPIWATSCRVLGTIWKPIRSTSLCTALLKSVLVQTTPCVSQMMVIESKFPMTTISTSPKASCSLLGSIHFPMMGFNSSP